VGSLPFASRQFWGGLIRWASGFDSFSDDPWVVRLVEFTKECLARGRPRVIGVCFGHQIVGRALGAKVARSEGAVWEVSVCQVEQTGRGKELFGGKDVLVCRPCSLLGWDGADYRQSIFQMHKDLVYYYPEGVEELGSSGPCKVQGMYVPKKVITVEGHPEFTEEIVRELLTKRREQGVFNEEVFRDAMGRVGIPHDGVLIAEAFLKFLMD